MSFSFPSNPTVNQTSTQNGRVYTWSGYAWELLGNTTNAGAAITSYANSAAFPATGSSGTYYLDSDTGRLYQWTGSYYAEIGPPISGVNNAQNAANLYLWSNFR